MLRDSNDFGYINKQVIRKKGTLGYHFALPRPGRDACPRDLENSLISDFQEKYKCNKKSLFEHVDSGSKYLNILDPDVALRVLLRDAGIETEEAEAATVIAEEIAEPSLYVEGATKQISVNAYERSREAVEECKRHHGTVCVICDFDFGAVYGAEFAGFIHVHHLRPLSEVGSEYKIDPIKDLRPVCPNCHAVIHHGSDLRSIEEMRLILNRKP